MSAEQPRDWDKELAEIDKIMAKSPAPAPGGGSKAVAPAAGGGKAPAAAAPRAAVPRGSALGTWLRVGLGVVLAAAMTQWPYFHACGTALFVYLGAVGVVGLSGVWGMVTSWRQRIGVAHVVSLLVFLWGLGLAAAVVLPRIGYARGVAAWVCP